ncbi:sphingosine 1-phosphate receptor 2-like [Amia ocellicauda]|uniref:sphingosine 1-phosphate receptor 2-like n=1 Tax=Amia ocellicauda TaxID=2972642 RepID=UPI003464BA07
MFGTYMLCNESPGNSFISQTFAVDLVQMTLGSAVVLINLLLVFSLLCASNLKKPCIRILASLSFSDCLLGLDSVFLGALELLPGGSSQWWFLVGNCVFVTSTLASLYSILGIAVERYLTLSNPKKVKTRSMAWVPKAIISMWILAVTFGAMPLMGWNCLNTADRCCASMAPMGIIYLLVVVVPNFVLALVALLFCYLRTLRCVMLWRVRIMAKNEDVALAGIKNREIKVAKTVAWVTGSFVVFYSPAVALAFLEPYWDNGDCLPPSLLKNIAATLILLNSLASPLTYGLKLKDVRTSVVRTCSFIWTCKL